MMALPFLFTGLHDAVIHVAGLLGMIALAGTFHGLYCHGYSHLFRYGVFCLALMLCNYFIYETGYLLSWLPVIQKGTFILFLSWVVLINRQTKIRLRRVNAQTDEQI